MLTCWENKSERRNQSWEVDAGIIPSYSSPLYSTSTSKASLNCLTSGEETQLPLDSVPVCSISSPPFFLVSPLLVSTASSSDLPSLPWTPSGHIAAHPFAAVYIPSSSKVGQERKRDRLCCVSWRKRADFQKNDPRTSCAGCLELLSHIGRRSTGMDAFAWGAPCSHVNDTWCSLFWCRHEPKQFLTPVPTQFCGITTAAVLT